MVLRQGNTFYIVVSAILYIGSIVDREFYGFDGFAFACFCPGHVFAFLCFTFMAMADACHPKVRHRMFCWCNPVGCLILFSYQVQLRMPGAANVAGLRTLWMLGVETMSNMDLTVKFGLVLLVLLARGTFYTWRHPERLAFFRARIVMDVFD